MWTLKEISVGCGLAGKKSDSQTTEAVEARTASQLPKDRYSGPGIDLQQTTVTSLRSEQNESSVSISTTLSISSSTAGRCARLR